MKLTALSRATILALFAACSSSGSAPPPPESAPLLLPGRGDTYMLFRDDGAEERGGTLEKPVTYAAGSTTGLPCTFGIDLSGEYAAVAYSGTVAAVKLSERTIDWLTPPWNGGAPRCVNVRGSMALALVDDTLYEVRLERDREPWFAKLGPWMEQDQHDIGTIHAAVPLGESEFLLVGHRDNAARVARIDRSAGAWRDVGTITVNELYELHACASDGVALYLAGTHWTDTRSPGQPMRAKDLDVALVVSRIDLATCKPREIVHAGGQDVRARITQVAAGTDTVVVVLADGSFVLYGISPTGKSAAPLAPPRRYDQPIAVAWVGKDKIAVLKKRDNQVEVRDIAELR
jgi:hypothetical protein